MKIIIKTLGCKANRYESDRIQEKFGDKFIIADAQTQKLDHADIIIVNTCTVTHVADRKSRQAISNLKKIYQNAKIIVFGCGANTDPDSYKKLNNVDFVVQKPEEIDKLIEKLSINYPDHYKPIPFQKNRTRALIKIQDGCNNFCSYCIVPYARGHEKSRSSKEIVDEINKKILKGYKEIVLTGINIGAWKEDNKDLADLIELILNKTTIERLRLSSIEPQNFSGKFIDLFKNPRFCPHLHIALQSGCDAILKSMRRRYDTSFYSKIVQRLREAVPNMSITTDIIVGFPGETEKYFNETVEFVKRIGFNKIHIFPYSKRKGTPAADMKNQLPDNLKKERCEKISKIEKEMRFEFYEKNVGRNENVLIETIDNEGLGIGFTSNYLKVRTHQNIEKKSINKVVGVKLTKVLRDCKMLAELES